MMKYFLFLFFCSSLLIFSCKNRNSTISIDVSPVNPETVIQEQQTTKDNSAPNDTFSDSIDEQPIPKVSMDPSQFIVTIVQTNLDLDSEDEQIIVYKKSKGDNSPITVAVVDFDTIRNKYVISWEHETDAANVRSFNLSLQDVTGDHNLEIICNGSDGNSNQTMNIFKRSAQVNSYGLLGFKAILSLKENGNLEILEEPRSQAYKTGITNGKSFPVIATINSGDPVKSFDLVRKTYYWRNEEGKYQLINTETIPGQEIEDKKLRSLLTGTKKNFEEFLSSLWILSSSEKNNISSGPIALFDLDARKITFYDNDIQEIYRWESSTKTLYNTLIINCRNDIVPYLKITLYIRLLDLNTISLIYKDDSMRNSKKATNKSWSGKYLKTDQSMENYLFSSSLPDENIQNNVHLTGYYKSDTGNELFFDPPRFELKTSDGIFHGGFYLYNIGVDILQFKYISNEHKVTKIETFKYDFLINKSDLEIIRTLVLIPGFISVTGFNPSNKTFIRYEQIEQLEPENDQ